MILYCMHDPLICCGLWEGLRYAFDLFGFVSVERVSIIVLAPRAHSQASLAFERLTDGPVTIVVKSTIQSRNAGTTSTRAIFVPMSLGSIPVL